MNLGVFTTGNVFFLFCSSFLFYSPFSLFAQKHHTMKATRSMFTPNNGYSEAFIRRSFLKGKIIISIDHLLYLFISRRNSTSASSNQVRTLLLLLVTESLALIPKPNFGCAVVDLCMSFLQIHMLRLYNASIVCSFFLWPGVSISGSTNHALKLPWRKRSAGTRSEKHGILDAGCWLLWHGHQWSIVKER